MSRPIKTGLRYFPMDVDFFRDGSIRRLQRHFGVDGITLYIYILCRVYENKGYYCPFDEDFLDDAYDDLDLDADFIRSVVDYLAEKSLIDKKLFEQYAILTSRGMQERYQECFRSHKRRITVIEDYWLLSMEESFSFIVPLGSIRSVGDYADDPATQLPSDPSEAAELHSAQTEEYSAQTGEHSAQTEEHSAQTEEHSAQPKESSLFFSLNKTKENERKEEERKPEDDPKSKQNLFSEKGKRSPAAADGACLTEKARGEPEDLRERQRLILERHLAEAIEQRDEGRMKSIRFLAEKMDIPLSGKKPKP